MRIIGLDGRSYSWNVSEYKRNLERSSSSYHQTARELLQRLYPIDRILEEVFLPGSGGLSADFYLPTRRLVVEVHGEQHYRFVSHFHKNITDFIAGKKRDAEKRQWCEMNKISFAELPYDRATEWPDRIQIAVTGREA